MMPEEREALQYIVERAVPRSLNAWFSQMLTLAGVLVLLVWSAQYWDDALLFLLGLVAVLIEQL
jgi:hypothetical protein